MPLSRARRALAPRLGPLRRLRRALRGTRDAPVILMYHRIAAPRFDPWGLSVAPATFRAQLEALKAHRTVIGMDELAGALAAGRVPRRAAAVTFDDGYADNWTVAGTILADLAVPATIFLTSPEGEPGPFWWDELAVRVLGSRTAATFEIKVAGARLAGQWDASPDPPERLAAWRAEDGPFSARTGAYLELWQALQRLPPPARAAALGILGGHLPLDGEGAEEDIGRRMSSAEASAASAAGIALGGHSRSHVDLTALAPQERAAEIARNRAEVAALAGAEPTGFAYPHGRWDAETRAAVRAAGYAWAVTTDRAVVDTRRHDPFALPRLAVGEWAGGALLARIESI